MSSERDLRDLLPYQQTAQCNYLQSSQTMLARLAKRLSLCQTALQDNHRALRMYAPP
jgi:hypothetical protein